MESGAVAMSLRLCSPIPGESNPRGSSPFHSSRKFVTLVENLNPGRIRCRKSIGVPNVPKYRRSYTRLSSLHKTSGGNCN